ncbi:MAG: PPOX class F420-dependent oxidoreductase [Anaerolineales bacterium]|nr:PPOX class F420-dependent oxidoreductase [Anaerolineales bacterium]
MSTDKLAQFERQNFINLESFYASGKGVKTPVWFVEDGGKLYVRTVDDSWKVRRIRQTPRVRVVPCKAQGQPLGEWVEGRARIVAADIQVHVNRLLNKKYGLQKKAFDLMGRKLTHTTIEIEL